jgi:predicted esterase
MAKAAEEQLQKNGAAVLLKTYEGGHGWHGDVYGRVRKGIEWLEKQREGRE